MWRHLPSIPLISAASSTKRLDYRALAAQRQCDLPCMLVSKQLGLVLCHVEQWCLPVNRSGMLQPVAEMGLNPNVRWPRWLCVWSSAEQLVMPFAAAMTGTFVMASHPCELDSASRQNKCHLRRSLHKTFMGQKV